jgi:hypothetical protein
MAERKAVTRQMARRYARASKKGKGVMLDELCELTGWTRRHARRALTAASRPPVPRVPAPRPRVYDEEVAQALRFCWALLGAPAGKRLAPFLPEIVEVLERTGEKSFTPQVRAKLVTISAATIDRVLAPERSRLKIKGRSGTKPGSILKRQIPIRTFADWDDARPGFCEVDLVAHDGGNANGEFCQTLVLTCVATGWTEMRALRNKAQRWSFAAIADVAATMPFPLLGLDSDNGAEFINDQLFRWCEANLITFTRSRPYRKNDNCFVEQKNFPVVRQQVGYARYDTTAELEVLTELYGHLRLFVNFFQPQMKLVSKTRAGAKVTRRYDRAATPYRRALGSPEVSEEAKAVLTRTYLELNPVELRRRIGALQDRLLEVNRTKEPKEVKRSPAPWQRPVLGDGRGSRTSPVRQREGATRTS